MPKILMASLLSYPVSYSFLAYLSYFCTCISSSNCLMNLIRARWLGVRLSRLSAASAYSNPSSRQNRDEGSSSLALKNYIDVESTNWAYSGVMLGKHRSIAMAYILLMYLVWSSGWREVTISQTMSLWVLEWQRESTRQAVLFMEAYCFCISSQSRVWSLGWVATDTVRQTTSMNLIIRQDIILLLSAMRVLLQGDCSIQIWLVYAMKMRYDLNSNCKYITIPQQSIEMQKKNKIAIAVTISIAVAITIGLVSASLDRLDFENYGLNYNLITANFTDDSIYTSGLYFIGFSNVLLEVPRTQRQLSLPDLTTYTNDYFTLEVSAQISYSLVLPSANQFTFLQDFYILFGEQPERILRPLFRNCIVSVVSGYSSTGYQSSQVKAEDIQAQIETDIMAQLSKWTNMEVKVLLSELVIKGISQNMEFLDRKIKSLVSTAKLVEARWIDLTPLIDSMVGSMQRQAEVVYSSIGSRVAGANVFANLSAVELGRVLDANQAVSNNLSLSSLELMLRQEQYLINDTIFY